MQPIIKKENILFDVEAKDKDDMIKQQWSDRYRTLRSKTKEPSCMGR